MSNARTDRVYRRNRPQLLLSFLNLIHIHINPHRYWPQGALSPAPSSVLEARASSNTPCSKLFETCTSSPSTPLTREVLHHPGHSFSPLRISGFLPSAPGSPTEDDDDDDDDDAEIDAGDSRSRWPLAFYGINPDGGLGVVLLERGDVRASRLERNLYPGELLRDYVSTVCACLILIPLASTIRPCQSGTQDSARLSHSSISAGAQLTKGAILHLPSTMYTLTTLDHLPTLHSTLDTTDALIRSLTFSRLAYRYPPRDGAKVASGMSAHTVSGMDSGMLVGLRWRVGGRWGEVLREGDGRREAFRGFVEGR